MKKEILILLVLLIAGQINAQVAHWVIHPNYDSIYFASGANLIITDSINEKIVWTLDGKPLFKTPYHLHPFCEGFAVATEQNSDIIAGFYNPDGKFTPVDENCSIAHNYPYFSNGYLLVQKEGKYFFVDVKGQLHGHNGQGFLSAYPFHHGYASCRNYKNPDKPKDKEIYNFLIKPINNKLQILSTFSFSDKTFSQDDVEFISSVNDEGIGIIVAKHKVYYFKGEKELKPVFTTPEENNLKHQVKLDGKVSEYLIQLINSDYVLYMNNEFSCLFNARMVPLEIGPNLKRIPFETAHTTKQKKTSPLTTTKDKEKNLFGLTIDGIEMLPPQFEAVYERFDNNVFVKTSGKQGLVRILKDEKFLPTINGRKEICFRHRFFDTNISIIMPAFIPSDKTIIESLDTSCIIDETSWIPKKTLQSNSINYDCRLNFPKDLYDYALKYPDNPKQETIKIQYPIQIISDGIRLPVIGLEAEVWYFKYLTIDINESSKTVNNGVGTFTFDIKAVMMFSDDDIYPLDVNIIADSLYPEPDCEQLPSNNRRYKGIVYNLDEGPNDITIKIEEKGCPPILYPHIITYTKPSPKNKHKKEDIEIKKKTEEEIEDDIIVPGL